jgi:hypothetical protein
MRLGALSMLPLFGLGWFFLFKIREDKDPGA